MRTLDRYIVREFISPFIYCIAIFNFLYIVIDLFNQLEDILRQGVSIPTLYSYYLSFVPIIFVQTAPIAVLLSTIYVLSRFNKHNEIVAMRASGVSLIQILRPLVCLGLILSIFVFLVNDKIVPRALVTSTTIRERDIEKVKTTDKSKIINNVAFYGSNNRLFFIESFDSGEKVLNDITILEHDGEQRVRVKIIAPRAEWIDENWKFYDCIIYQFPEEGGVPTEMSVFEEIVLDIEEKPDDFLMAKDRTDFMSYYQLRNYIRRLAGAGGATIRRLRVDLHHRLSFPFISLIIMLIGVPFALVSRRGGALFGVGICLAISLSYYGVNAVSMAMGKGGMLPAALSAWLANILFGALGIGLIRKLAS